MDNELLPFYVKRKEEINLESPLECKDGFCSLPTSKSNPLKLSEIGSLVFELISKYGDLEVVGIDYGNADYQESPEIYLIKPVVVSHPKDETKKVVIFD